MEFFPVEVRASFKALRREYLKLALVYHPDKELDPLSKHTATETFQCIHAVYEDLVSKISDASFHTKPTRSKSLLCIACELGDLVEVQRLLKERPMSAYYVDDFGKTPIMFAAEGGSLDVCRALLDVGVDVDASNRLGWSPLVFSAIKDNAEIARLLIEFGAVVSEKTVNMAAHMGSFNVLELLLSLHADSIVSRTADGYTVLHVALRGFIHLKNPIAKHHKTVKILLEAGCDVHARGPKHDSTLIMFVSDFDQPWAADGLKESDLHLDIVRQLCELKADPCEDGPNGMNALEIATEQGNFHLQRVLQAYGMWA